MENREKMWFELVKYYGLKEIPGTDKNNPIILQWFQEMGFTGIKDDETSWCSLTINVMAKRLGLSYTGKLNARSWLDIGKETKTPQLGDVVVFWRNKKNSWEGHVGLFAGISIDNKILVLGGNQGNMIDIAAYPIVSPTFGLLGYREL